MNVRDAVKLTVWIALTALLISAAIYDAGLGIATLFVLGVLIALVVYEPRVVRANQVFVISGRFDGVIYNVVDRPGFYFRFRLLDRVAAILNSTPVALDARAHAVRSADGVPFEVTYRLLYRIDLSEYDPDLLTQTVDFLANPRVGLTHQAEDYLRHTFARFTADKVMMARYRNAITQVFRSEIEDSFKRQGFAITVVNLREFTAPADYQNNHLAAHGRQIENNATIAAYNDLASGTRSLNETDRSLVIASEKLRILNHIRSNTVLHLPYGDDGWTPMG